MLDDPRGRITRFILEKLNLRADDQGEFFYGQAKIWLTGVSEKKVLETADEIITLRGVREPISFIKYMKRSVDTIVVNGDESKKPKRTPKAEKPATPKNGTSEPEVEHKPLWEMPGYEGHKP